MDLGASIIKYYFKMAFFFIRSLLFQVFIRQKNNFPVFLVFTVLLFFSNCARQGTPSGGDKDTEPPRVVWEKPPSGTTNFKGDRIIIKFDEFITLENPLQKILFSPPLHTPPEIKPSGYADKKIEIRFKEKLLPNTTYTIHFNDAIKDFHEGNVLKNYTYVFSTGSQLDTLQLTGKVSVAPDFELPENILVALYPDSLFNDSLVYHGKPYYLAHVSKDGTFVLKNLHEGNYYVLAFSDKNGSLNYQPGEEYVGFLPAPVHIPGDKEVHVVLFKEKLPLKIEDVTEKTLHHWVAPYSGTAENWEVKIENRQIKYYSSKKTLDLWIKPVEKGDTLLFRIFQNKDTVFEGKRIAKGEKKDTLLLQFHRSEIAPLDTLYLLPTVPVIALDTTAIKMRPSLPYRYLLTTDGRAGFIIPYHDSLQKIELKLLPGSVTDFLGNRFTDTLTHKFSFISAKKTGSLLLKAEKDFPAGIIIQLYHPKKQKIIRQKIMKKPQQTVRFPYLLPGKYRLRIIYDANGNGKWDPGNLKDKIQPEKVYIYPQIIEIRALWHIEEKISLPLD